jgi:uncharacterized membrane protein
MRLDPVTLTAILVMAAAAAACRLSGFWFMRFIPVTPRLEAGLRAIPLAVMIALLVPPVLRGGLPEIAGLVATLAVMRLAGQEVVAIIAGMAAVAGMRWAGF